VAAHPQPVAAGAMLDLIIQTSGSAQALARQVRALGGEVHFVYRNLPAIAASIPFDKFNEVSNLAGVTSIQKDLPVRLPEDQPDKVVIGQGARHWSFPVETSAVVRPLPLNISSSKPNIEPQGYANFMYTGADQIWEETGYGAGSVVAVIDSGVYPNSCLQHAVIGASGYPQGYNATGDGIPATDIQNGSHGTWVSGLIAGDCYLDFSENPDDVVYQAISAYLPWPPEYVPLLGQAPLAKIYPVKVFPIDADSSFSIVLQGLDHVLSLKRDGLLDIDVVNLSLGWSSLYEERDIYEDMVSLLNDTGILVVSAAGNEGPIPNSILTPASTSASLAVGGLDYASSSRIWSELIGLIFGLNWIEFDGDEFAGMGMVTRPSAETKVADFASRGPLSNGHLAPDLAALSNDPLVIDQFDELWFGLGGTSFGTPSVAGVAALLNAYLEQTLGQEDAVISLRNALLKGASLEALGEKWRGVNEVGFGALDAVGALERIQSGDLNLQYPVEVGKLRANILGAPLRDHTETYQSQQITLQQLEKFDRIFAISPFTSKVTIEVYDMVIPDNSDRTAFLNYLQLHVQSAKRGTWHPVGWWLGSDHPEIARIEITDGPGCSTAKKVCTSLWNPG
jgi:subtilisin family serine protease